MIRAAFDYVIARAAAKLGYVPASRLALYQGKTQRAAKLVAQWRRDATRLASRAATAEARERRARRTTVEAISELADAKGRIADLEREFALRCSVTRQGPYGTSIVSTPGVGDPRGQRINRYA
jgi:hypothetical protein